MSTLTTVRARVVWLLLHRRTLAFFGFALGITIRVLFGAEHAGEQIPGLLDMGTDSR